MFLHLPVNHRYRAVYRFLAALTGAYVLVFGIAGVAVSGGHGLFARGHLVALGLHTNLAFSVLSIVVGAIVVVAALVGHNADHYLTLFGGMAFLAVGMAMLALLRTSLNILNFTVATCVVSFLIGLVLFTAGLYSRTGSPDQVREVERHRHQGGRAEQAQPAAG
jgi:hypothetical protein